MNTQQIDYQQLAAAMFDQVATKAAGSTPTATWGHGSGGTFSPAGLDRALFNSVILPHTGLQKALPVFVSNDTSPLYGIVTGITAASGDNPTGLCDDFPSAGVMQMCTTSVPFGRIGLDSQVYNIDRAGELTNRGEFLDLQMIGGPVQTGAGVPTIPGGAGSPLNSEYGKALTEFGWSWAIKYARLLYTGNTSNNTSGGGYKEFYGLETLINDNYRDAETGDACAAADSIIHSFGQSDVTDSSADIVGVIQDIVHRTRTIASRAGFSQVKRALVMPYDLFYRLSEVWAYYYFANALNGLTFSTNFNVDLDAKDASTLRDQFRGNMETRTGQFLMVDGERIDVILDDAIPETEVSPGQFTSDIYLVPLVANGNPVTFMNYYNFMAPGGAVDLAKLAPRGFYEFSDRGAFAYHFKPPTNFCVEMTALAKPRLVVRTPYLAARITDVKYSPKTQHVRSAFVGESYHVAGGVSTRTGPSFYSPTSS